MAVPVDVIPRRPTLLFIVVLSLLFVLMSLSSRTRYIGETRTMFERSVMTIFAPVPKVVNWVGTSASDAFHGYLDMRHSVQENADLRHKVDELTTENLRLRQPEGDLPRLRSLLGYSEQFTMPTIVRHAQARDSPARLIPIVMHGVPAVGV